MSLIDDDYIRHYFVGDGCEKDPDNPCTRYTYDVCDGCRSLFAGVKHYVREAINAKLEEAAQQADQVAEQARTWMDDLEPDFFVPIAEGLADQIRQLKV